MVPRPNSTDPIGARAFATRFLACSVLLVLVLYVAAGSAAAAVPVAHAPVTIEVDKAQILQLSEPAATVFVANPDIADVQVPQASENPTNVIVYGKKAGDTTVYAVTASGKIIAYPISVKRQISEISDQLRKQVPQAKVDVASAPNGITMSGHVASPGDAQRLKSAARQFLGDKESLNFNVSVDAATQVNLHVRVAEVSREVDKQFGFNWQALFNNGTIAVGLLTGREPLTNFGNFIRGTSLPLPDSLGLGYRSSGGSVNVSTLIDALEQEGLVTVLAEPNLTTISGEAATFLAGGEFPIPVSQGLQQVTIEFKRFGVSVDFLPIVLDANRLSIKVRPEVSELSDKGAVIIDSIKIPGLSIRRADTTVEMASGQSFAIAGLFQNNVSNQIQRFPWLGDVPILGALFRSSSYQRNESELVIIVTPYIVRPTNNTNDLHLPTDGIVFANDLEQILLGKLTGDGDKASPPRTDAPHLYGPAGFMTE
jgi:pilus assembly protein CpaC